MIKIIRKLHSGDKEITTYVHSIVYIRNYAIYAVFVDLFLKTPSHIRNHILDALPPKVVSGSWNSFHIHDVIRRPANNDLDYRGFPLSIQTIMEVT